MYSYTFDSETGGIILNSTPTNFSKEPRPVYAAELDILGFDKYWDYNKQNDVPYMWAESNIYWYRGVQIAKTKGGDLYTAPELQPVRDENGSIPFGKADGAKLEQMDIEAMCAANEDLLTVIEDSTVKKIVKEYEKFKDKLDIFHVAFSGGKDSAVLLDLVKKALPKGSFVVIFGDTGMEFPEMYAHLAKLDDRLYRERGLHITTLRHPPRALNTSCSTNRSRSPKVWRTGQGWVFRPMETAGRESGCAGVPGSSKPT